MSRATLPKLKVSELSIGARVRQDIHDAENPPTYRQKLYCRVVALDPGPTSTWVTLKHPLSGGYFRIRPRNDKLIVAVPPSPDFSGSGGD